MLWVVLDASIAVQIRLVIRLDAATLHQMNAGVELICSTLQHQASAAASRSLVQ